MDGTSDPYVHLAVVRGNNADKQLFRYETKVAHNNRNPVYDESFFVPGADGQVTLVFTVIDHDELRNDFLGQAVLRLRGTSVWRTGGEWTLDLDDSQITPKEADSTAMRLSYAMYRPGGTIKVCVEPFSNVTSVCGALAEKITLGSSKKWWCVMADKQLRLYKYYGHTKAKTTIKLDKVLSLHVTRHGETVELIDRHTFAAQCHHNHEHGGNTVENGGDTSSTQTGSASDPKGSAGIPKLPKEKKMTKEEKKLQQARLKQQAAMSKQRGGAAQEQLATLEIGTYDKRVWAFQFTSRGQERTWINRLKRAAGMYHQKQLRHRNAPPPPIVAETTAEEEDGDRDSTDEE